MNPELELETVVEKEDVDVGNNVSKDIPGVEDVLGAVKLSWLLVRVVDDANTVAIGVLGRLVGTTGEVDNLAEVPGYFVGEEDGDAREVADEVVVKFDEIGSGTTTVTGGGLTSMIEYPVVVTVVTLGEGVIVINTVLVVSDPSTVCVETT